MGEAQRRTLNAPTQAEADDAGAKKAEKAIHVLFESWLMLNELDYVHARMDKKSTIKAGHPDFTIFGPKGTTVFVEIKVPGKTLSVDQMAVMLSLLRKGHHYMVCHSDVEAINFTAPKVGLR
jgi:hypothetical protein